MSELVERWPGYDEQSWAERFAELNRRHDSLFRSFNALHEEAIKALAEKRDRIEQLEREEGWQPIETAPKDGTSILVWATTKPPHYEDQDYIETVLHGEHVERVQPALWHEDDGMWDMYYIGTPLFWRPLPEPPTIRSGDAG